MRKTRLFLNYWLPVLVWTGLIFTASGDSRSSQRSSHIIEPIVRWLFPHISDDTVQLVVFCVRKCAHFTEYAALALLVWRAVRKPAKNDPRPWLWSQARLALFIVALYAASDELHQAFVPTREARVHDVVLDTTGAAFGLLALWLFGKWRKLW